MPIVMNSQQDESQASSLGDAGSRLGRLHSSDVESCSEVGEESEAELNLAQVKLRALLKPKLRALLTRNSTTRD